MVVTVNDFEGEITLGQLKNPYTAEAVNVLIAKYEPLFMRMCIGEALYQELLAGLAVTPVDSKWDALKSILLLPCASYIYCYYMQLMVSQTTGHGLIDPNVENGGTVNPESKIVRAWNEMVMQVKEAQGWLAKHKTDYPSFTYCWSDIQVEKNLYGL